VGNEESKIGIQSNIERNDLEEARKTIRAGKLPFDFGPIIDDLGSVQNYQRERCWEKVPQCFPQNGGHKMGENAQGV
jgi:hypothetical protein